MNQEPRPAPEYQLTPGQYSVGPDVDLEREDIHDSQGRRITEEYIEAAVAHARKAAGRPSLSGQAVHSPHVSFRVASGVREKAEQVARREGKTVSQLAREALQRYLDEAA